MQNLPPNYVEVVNADYVIQPDDLYFYTFWPKNYGPSQFSANWKQYIGKPLSDIVGYPSVVKVFTNNVHVLGQRTMLYTPKPFIPRAPKINLNKFRIEQKIHLKKFLKDML